VKLARYLEITLTSEKITLRGPGRKRENMGPMHGIGFIYEISKGNQKKYIGSAFCFLSPTIFITAAHCVDRSPENLWINHVSGPIPDLCTKVYNIKTIPNADLAVFQTEAPRAQWAKPFTKVKYGVPFGTEVCSLGATENLIDWSPGKETMRMHRGYVQRPFCYQRHPYAYTAFELSYMCPGGLSGSPVFLADSPDTVIGVVTGNFETYTTLEEEFEETIESRVFKRKSTRKVISYGIATNLENGIEVFDEVFKQVLGKPFPLQETIHFP
jgi:hypothetical protein